MDLLRFHKFTIGHAWCSDYGNPDEKIYLEHNLKISPLHNIPRLEVSKNENVLNREVGKNDEVSKNENVLNRSAQQFRSRKCACYSDVLFFQILSE